REQVRVGGPATSDVQPAADALACDRAGAAGGVVAGDRAAAQGHGRIAAAAHPAAQAGAAGRLISLDIEVQDSERAGDGSVLQDFEGQAGTPGFASQATAYEGREQHETPV